MLEKEFLSTFPEFERQFNGFSEIEKIRFLNSFSKTSEADWKRFFSLLKTLSVPKQTASAISWRVPQCFSANNLAAKGYDLALLREVGSTCFRKGEVAMLTVAGGLGTRLKFNGPKGLVPITPIKHKTLFQVFAEKLKALQVLYKHPLHWLIMTSEETDVETRQAFEKYKWYDLAYVHFFKQGTLPAFTEENFCALNSDGTVHYCPDGHGGVFNALETSGLLNDLKTWGIKTVSYFQVDNPLVFLGDTLFLGLHQMQGSEFSTKVVPKRSANERVGVFANINGRLQLVEYSEFPEYLAQQKNKENQLMFRCGNTAIHLLSVDFIERCLTVKLPCHVVKKTMDFLDSVTQQIFPKPIYKLERFIFDALPYARNTLLFEIERAEEFSPVKNAEGEDSLFTCQRDQCQRWLCWFRKKVDNALQKELDAFDFKNNNLVLEISPLFADDFYRFSERWDCLENKPNYLQGLFLE